MSEVGLAEKVTQERVVKLFRERLGYTYLGNWIEGERSIPVEDRLRFDGL